jgi:hypothetical protein
VYIQKVLTRFPVNKDMVNDDFFFAISTTSSLIEEDAWLKFPTNNDYYPKEIKLVAKDSNQSNLLETQTCSKVKISEQLGEDRVRICMKYH